MDDLRIEGVVRFVHWVLEHEAPKALDRMRWNGEELNYLQSLSDAVLCSSKESNRLVAGQVRAVMPNALDLASRNPVTKNEKLILLTLGRQALKEQI